MMVEFHHQPLLKSKIMKNLLIMILLLGSTTYALADVGFKCLVSPGENAGYCAKGMDGKGKCVEIKVSKIICAADWPLNVE